MSEQGIVEVYRAKNGFQAHVLVKALEEAGIKASIQGGYFHHATDSSDALGAPPWWDAPRITVLAHDAERAKQLLLDREAREREKTGEAEGAAAVESICQECGRGNRFPATLCGTVQTCRHCGAYVDVEGPKG